jgi:hypothetical protein
VGKIKAKWRRKTPAAASCSRGQPVIPIYGAGASATYALSCPCACERATARVFTRA